MNLIFPSSKNTEIFVGVQFGMPSKNCRNFGICRIEAITSQDIFSKIRKQRPCYGIGRIKVTPGGLEFQFFKNSISVETINRHFPNNSFKVIEKYQLPMSVANKLSRFDLAILPGEYLLEESNNRIKFKVNIDRAYRKCSGFNNERAGVGCS